MSTTEHILERRARLLAGKIQKRTEMLRNSLAPAGQRPPFAEQLTEGEALNWWRQHRHDEYGQQMTARMGQQDVMELDAALAKAGVVTDGPESGGGL